jgi:ribonuclease HII
MKKGIKHLLNIPQVQRSSHTNSRVRDRAEKLEKRFKSVSVDSLTETNFDKRGNQMTQDPSLHNKAIALIQEAAFIGIIKKQTRDKYLQIAKTNLHTFNNIRDILKVEKQELVARYDYLLRHDKLATLEPEEYATLYKAKYLTEPPKSKQLN